LFIFPTFIADSILLYFSKNRTFYQNLKTYDYKSYKNIEDRKSSMIFMRLNSVKLRKDSFVLDEKDLFKI